MSSFFLRLDIFDKTAPHRAVAISNEMTRRRIQSVVLRKAAIGDDCAVAMDRSL